MLINSNQELVATEYSIRLFDKSNKETLYPLGAVGILSDIQLRIGQSYSGFVKLFEGINVPIILNKSYDVNGINLIQVIKLGFCGKPELLLGVITVYKGMIASYQYNDIASKIKGNSIDLKISALQQIRIPINTKSIGSYTCNILSMLLKEDTSSSHWKMAVCRGNTIDVYYDNDIQVKGKTPLNYYFSPDGNGNLYLSTIGYDLNSLVNIQ